MKNKYPKRNTSKNTTGKKSLLKYLSSLLPTNKSFYSMRLKAGLKIINLMMEQKGE